MDVAALYVDARAKSLHIPAKVVKMMDEAQDELKRAKRRLEQTQRRLAKKEAKVNAR